MVSKSKKIVPKMTWNEYYALICKKSLCKPKLHWCYQLYQRDSFSLSSLARNETLPKCLKSLKDIGNYLYNIQHGLNPYKFWLALKQKKIEFSDAHTHLFPLPFCFICESCLVKRNLKFRKLCWNLANFSSFFLQTPWVFTCVISECLIFIGNFLLVQSPKKQKKSRLPAQRSVVFVRRSVSTYVRT